MGKAVQHLCSLTDGTDRLTVIFLVQKKACFLSFFYIHHIVDTVFYDLHIGIKLLSQKTFDTLHSFLQPFFGIAALVNTADRDTVSCKNFLQKLYEMLLVTVNSQSQGFYYQNITEFVDHQSRQKIRLTKDEPAA